MLIVILYLLVMLVPLFLITGKTIYAVDSYYQQLPFIGAILSSVGGGVLWDKEERKLLTWSWKSCRSFLSLVAVFAVPGYLIGGVIDGAIEVLNYYIPTDKPCYDTYAKVDRKTATLSTPIYLIKFRPDKKETKEAYYELSTGMRLEVGGEYVFTLRNGFFNIPIVMGCKHVDTNDIQIKRD